MDERAAPVSTVVRRRATSELTLPLHLTSAATSTNSSSSSSSSYDAELLSAVITPATSSYTSLKDLIPSCIADSPRPTRPAHDETQSLSIRNRLLQRAAWAYPSPGGASPGSEGGGFLVGRVWSRVAALLAGVKMGLAWVVEWALRVVGMRSSR